MDMSKAGAETATPTNSQFDLYLVQKTITLKQGGTSTFWVPVEWYPGWLSRSSKMTRACGASQ